MPSRRYWRGRLYRLAERLRVWTQPPRRQILVVTSLVTTVCLVSYALPASPPRPIAAPPSNQTTVTVSTDHPDEAPPATYRSTAVGAEPKYLRLPSIKAEGFVQKVGIDQNRQVAVPTNIHLAGWFMETVTPGEPGLSIIDGHLDGRTQPGIFAGLDQLKPSDAFTIELANGTIRRFLVTSVQSLPVSEAAAALFSQTPGITRQLNLITCGGTYNGSAGYDHRVVVASRLVE